MNSFLSLSPLLSSCFCSWTVLLCIGFTVDFVFAVVERHKLYVSAAAVGFLPSYFVFQLCREIKEAELSGLSRIKAAASIAQLPLWFFVILCSLLTVFCVFLFIRENSYTKNHITPKSIKEAADGLDAGIAFYREDGCPFLVNHKMNELSFAVTGEAFLNGNIFADAIDGKNTLSLGDRIYRFVKYEFSLEKEPFYEIIAEDVTQLCNKTEYLKKENIKLRANNELMREYGERIDDTVRREEILKSKVNIHDEMNRLLLAADKAVHSENEDERRSVLATWQKNVLLLCIEADFDESTDSLTDIEELSRLIGVNLHRNKYPSTKNTAVLRLFVLAAEEALTNAVKHAGAENFYIEVNEDVQFLHAEFTNDGSLPSGKISEFGGLATLREHIEKAGGIMKIDASPAYRLSITLPLGGK